MTGSRAVGVAALLLLVIPHASYATKKVFTEVTGGYRRPDFLRDSLEKHKVRVGHDVTFTCQVQNIGNYKVAWLHADKGIIAVHPDVLGQNDRIKSTHDNRDSWSLVIKSVQESDAGKYICQVNTETPHSISGLLSVEVPPDIIDEQSSSDTLATEGMSVALSCEATGVPPPLITWRREGEEGQKSPHLIRLCESDHGKRRKSSNREHKCREAEEWEGNVLELNNLNRFDSGVYLCIANNKVPPSVSKRVQLYVDFPPTIWISHQLVGVESGANVTIECMTSGHPPPLLFWYRGSTAIPPQRSLKYLTEDQRVSSGEQSLLMRLTIFNLTREDTGKYRCEAKNSLGSTDGEISLYEISTSTVRSSTTTEASTLGTWTFWGHREHTTEPPGQDRRRLNRRLEPESSNRPAYSFSDASTCWSETSLALTGLLVFAGFLHRTPTTR